MIHHHVLSSVLMPGHVLFKVGQRENQLQKPLPLKVQRSHLPQSDGTFHGRNRRVVSLR